MLLFFPIPINVLTVSQPVRTSRGSKHLAISACLLTVASLSLPMFMVFFVERVRTRKSLQRGPQDATKWTKRTKTSVLSEMTWIVLGRVCLAMRTTWLTILTIMTSASSCVTFKSILLLCFPL